MSRHRVVNPSSLCKCIQSSIKRTFCPGLRCHSSIKNLILFIILIVGCLLILQNINLNNNTCSNVLILAKTSTINFTLTNHTLLVTKANTMTVRIANGNKDQQQNSFQRPIINMIQLGPNGSSPVHQNSAVDCHPGTPCVYPENDVIDFRIIVLTYERNNSLIKLLTSLDDLEMDGDVGQLEIWIDRNKNNTVFKEVVDYAKSFNWTKGHVRVHVQEKHVGLYGQWIDTYRPRPTVPGMLTGRARSRNNLPDVGELVLILEDDMSVSRYAYRWLKAAHHFYANRTDVAGLTLQSEGIIVAKTGAYFSAPMEGLTFLYKYMSSWGFAPRAGIWSKFQDWYYKASANPTFHPYVSGILPTQWYKHFEDQGRADSMWTMWFIYYCHQHKLYTLYNNIRRNTNSSTCCMGINRRERGLHFKGRGARKNVQEREVCLTCEWKDEFLNFSHQIPVLEYNGKTRATL